MNLQRIIQLLKENLLCQACGQIFEEHNIQFAGAAAEAMFFIAYCDRGHLPSNSFIKAVAPSPDAVESIISKTMGVPLTTDEALDFKNSLVGFDGDFTSMLNK